MKNPEQKPQRFTLQQFTTVLTYFSYSSSTFSFSRLLRQHLPSHRPPVGLVSAVLCVQEAGRHGPKRAGGRCRQRLGGSAGQLFGQWGLPGSLCLQGRPESSGGVYHGGIHQPEQLAPEDCERGDRHRPPGSAGEASSKEN